jgi:hypothetical protein
VGRDFDCSYCTALPSLQGAPPEVRGNFEHGGCVLLPKEQVELLEDRFLFKKWILSGLEFNEWKLKKRGMITARRFGF